MGCGPSVQQGASESSEKRRDSRVPPVPKMISTHLEMAVDDKADVVMAPLRLQPLAMQLFENDVQYDLATPDLESAPARAKAPCLPSVESTINQGLSIQRSLSVSTQRQCGLSENTSNHSLSISDYEWSPREFGPLVESFYVASSRQSADTNDNVQAVLDDDEDDGFYFRFVRMNGAAAVSAKRTISAKELLQHSSYNVGTRLLSGWPNTPAGTFAEAPGRSPTTTHGAGDGKLHQQRRSRYATVRELGQVDADSYIDALYLHSRERERTHFFIDPDGEIRRLYHTEGWHTLGSTKRRQGLLRQRSNSVDSNASHKGHRSRKISNGHSNSHNTHGNFSLPATDISRPNARHAVIAAVGQSPGSTQKGSSDVGIYPPSEQMGGDTLRLHNTPFGNLSTRNATGDTLRPPTSPLGKGRDSARDHEHDRGSPVSQKQSSSPRQSPFSDQKRTNSQMRKAASLEVQHTESAASASIGSGRASTLPDSHVITDFYHDAFGDDGETYLSSAEPVLSGVAQPSVVKPHISPILMRPDGDFPGSTSRRGSFSSTRREGDGDDGYPPDTTSQRRRLFARRVSFSKETRYFKKDPFYVVPRSETESTYTDLTTQGQRMRASPQNLLPVSAATEAEATLAPLAPTRLNASPSYAQLTLLKDKMMQSRERGVPSPM